MSFDVLSRSTQVFTHLLIEASAGTGKTFTIEQLFIRRLLDSNKPLLVREMALVTFTRACAREMKERIYKTIQKTIDLVELGKKEELPDYLVALLEHKAEMERDVQKEVLEKLRRAQSEIDEAIITTIHGFCENMLSEYTSESRIALSSSYITEEELEGLIWDYLFFAQEDKTTKFELYALLLDHGLTTYAFVEKLRKHIWDEVSFQNIVQQELDYLKSTAKNCAFSKEEVLQTLIALSSSFTGLQNRRKEVKEEVLAVFRAFAALFQDEVSEEELAELVASPLLFDELFKKQSAKIKENEAAENLKFLEFIKNKFQKSLDRLGKPELIFKEQLARCREFVKKAMQERALLSFDELLLKTQKKLQEAEFLSFLQGRFQAVFVDEFQDTDPVQWDIFSKAFLDSTWQGNLYLVGDPKQAIYAFRKADVYNYIRAKEAISYDHHVKLATNFRSEGELTEALNTLFIGPHTEKIFYLPQEARALSVAAVGSPVHLQNQKQITDERGAIHFFEARGALGRKRNWPHEELEKELFSFILAEYQELTRKHKLSVAVLVKDRYQSERFERFLKEYAIACRSYKRESITASPAFSLWQRLLEALENPKNKRTLIRFVSMAPFFLIHETKKMLEETEEALFLWASYVEGLFKLKKMWNEGSVSVLAGAFLNMEIGGEKVGAQLEKNSKEFIIDFEEITDFLIQEESAGKRTGRDFLHALDLLQKNGDDGRQRRYEQEEGAIQILTMHKSKGLEFDVVFALGASVRTKDEDVAEAEKEERDAEKLRQFYVACTRAKKRLYLPVLYEDDEKIPKSGTLSLVELFFMHLSGASCALHEALTPQTLKSALQELQQKSPFISHGPIEKRVLVPALCGAQHVRSLDEKALIIEYQKRYVHSFSSQKKERDYVHKSQEQERAKEELKSNKEVGIFLHALIAEWLVLKDRKSTERNMEHWLEKKLANTPYEPHKKKIFEMLYFASNCPIPAKENFTLADVDLTQAFFEMPFLYEQDAQLVMGTIDLFFEHQGAFYAVDWKSNSLDSRNVKAALHEIKAQGYTRQAEIYEEALNRYLASFEKKLTAFYFVFLRDEQVVCSKETMC